MKLINGQAIVSIGVAILIGIVLISFFYTNDPGLGETKLQQLVFAPANSRLPVSTPNESSVRTGSQVAAWMPAGLPVMNNEQQDNNLNEKQDNNLLNQPFFYQRPQVLGQSNNGQMMTARIQQININERNNGNKNQANNNRERNNRNNNEIISNRERIQFVANQTGATAANTPRPRSLGDLADPQKIKSYVSRNIRLSEAHWQGLEALPLSTELKLKLQLPMDLEGVLIDEVTLNSARSGLRGGDVLSEVNNQPVKTLEDLVRESKRVQNQPGVNIKAYRKGHRLTFNLQADDTLGFAQVETAPMIVAGAIRPHPYRGSCTLCHAIGTIGNLMPDPDTITLPPPRIDANAVRPHQDRGPCQVCHKVR